MVDTPAQANERRRVSREEGQKLLFGAAQDVARRQGALSEGIFASFEESSLSKTSYALRSVEGQMIARIPISEAREILSFRRKVARKLLQEQQGASGGFSAGMGLSQGMNKQQVRMQGEKVRALAWAISSGRRFPYAGSAQRQWIITGLLLLCCVVPGVVYGVSSLRVRAEAKRQLDKLVARWRANGRPDPPESFFLLYDL